MSHSQTKLPLFEISGTSPYQIGYNYGVILRDRIKSTVNVYYRWLINIGGNDKMLEQQCNEYQLLIKQQCPEINKEIEGISKGSGEMVWKIYLLNCRTEIFNFLYEKNKKRTGDKPCECSGIMNVSNCINAQNWDWIEEMHDNAILLRIKKPNHTMLMLIEPGMVGKIGLNSNGIGCTLFLLSKPNFLVQNNINQNNMKGIPIHVILRLFLECKSLQEIDKLLMNITVNTYSCIGVTDDKQNGYFMEFCGYGKCEKLYAAKKQFSFHTNHYLGCGLKYIGEDEEDKAESCSLPRYNQLKSLYDYRKCKNENKFDNRTEVIEQLLTNDMHKEWPICRAFVYRKSFSRKIGTITTVIMNLKKRSMSISRGSPLQYPFQSMFVDKNDSNSTIGSKL